MEDIQEPDGERVVIGEEVLTGIHRGSVRVAGRLHLLRTVQGSLVAEPASEVNITGEQQGSVHIAPGQS